MSSAENNQPQASAQHRLSKYRRQRDAFAAKKRTARDLEIISAVERYRLLPTSLLVRLIEGNEDVTYRHLQKLFHQGLLNRFAFPRVGGSNEFNYYLDNPKALTLLIDEGLRSREDLDYDSVRANREKAYHHITYGAEDSSGRALFLNHELMITRFHYMLEMACRKSGKASLAAWQQGPQLHSSVIHPDGGDALPHRPDAYFSLQWHEVQEGRNKSHFFYEADRNRTSIPKMLVKLKGHYEFIRQQKHQEKYAIKRIRAVLIETLDNKRAEDLREASRQVCSVPLFWFTSSEILSAKLESAPIFFKRPGIILQNIWLTAHDDSVVALDQ